MILLQMRAVDAMRRWREIQAEALDGPPELWQAIYGETEGHLALFVGQRRGGRLQRPQEGYFRYPDHLADAVGWVREAVAAEAEVYMCGHFTTERHRRKETSAPLASLYVSLDHARLGREAAMPTVTIQSSPGRLRCYWRLTDSVSPAEGEALNWHLSRALGADKSGWDLTQLLRVPGTQNRKYPDAPLVTVLADTGQRHRSHDVLNALAGRPRLAEPPRLQQEPLYRPESGPVPDLASLPLTAGARRVVLRLSPKLRPTGEVDRSASLLRLARVLAGAGLAGEPLAAALAERDRVLVWRKYTDRDDARHQYERLVALVAERR